MFVTDIQKKYSDALDTLGNKKFTIMRVDVYKLLKEKGCDEYITFPEDINAILLKDKYGQYKDWRKFEIPEDIEEEMYQKSKIAIEKAKESTEDDSADLNIFKMKYCNRGEMTFEIPIVEIAKDYLLCYQKNVENFRRNTPDRALQIMQKIYEVLLKGFKQDFISGLNSKDVGDDKIEDQVSDIHREHRQKYGSAALEAKEELHKRTRAVRAYYESIRTIVQQISTTSDPMQVFIDLVENSYSSPEVKKALSVYKAIQADNALYSQINAQLEANNENTKEEVEKKIMNNPYGNTLHFDYDSFLSMGE